MGLPGEVVAASKTSVFYFLGGDPDDDHFRFKFEGEAGNVARKILTFRRKKSNDAIL